ncbi:LAMI_0G05754g1_1 [Lachancea mirantina]|uniref:LAMI_0G05754g1_1 n=1 Tax=Lachancea mirantina TaxID=1230905 RepID=A0A1G4K8Z0_9SACH|nr:LAMI_0G05754g1_1 [Lachancea mirantina]
MSHSCEQEHHECSPPPPETNASQSLYDFIDTAKTVCLNCVGKGNSGTVAECLLKSQEQKFNVSSYIESDADCQVLVHIPFTSNCRIFSVIIRCNQAEDDLLGSPKTIKLYKNFRKNIDFDTVKDMKPTHHFENPQNVGLADPGSEEYIQDESSFVEHHLPRRHFQNCHSLTLLIDDNWAADEDLLTRCYYLELRGECSGNLPAGDGIPLMAVYEAAPSPLDHKKLESEQETTNLGM